MLSSVTKSWLSSPGISSLRELSDGEATDEEAVDETAADEIAADEAAAVVEDETAAENDFQEVSGAE